MATKKNKTEKPSPLAVHGAKTLPSVEVESYNLEITDDEGFIGDKASKKGFAEILDGLRASLAPTLTDPFGDKPALDIGRKKIDEMLSGEPAAASLVHGAIEGFAQELARIIRRFAKNKSWENVEAIVIGGGFQASRVGKLAIARTSHLLHADALPIRLLQITRDPDDAGLIGSAHLLPSWPFAAHDGLLAVDIGGTNIRAGIVEHNLGKASDLSQADVWERTVWRHADETVSREETVGQLAELLKALIRRAEKKKFALAPVIGIGCPGIIQADGSIDRGAQNLPGNWQSSRFHLPDSLIELIPEIGGYATQVVMHNDAVVQGLSELPGMQTYRKWGVLTIGTGLGNACFTNHTPEIEPKSKPETKPKAQSKPKAKPKKVKG